MPRGGEGSGQLLNDFIRQGLAGHCGQLQGVVNRTGAGDGCHIRLMQDKTQQDLYGGEP